VKQLFVILAAGALTATASAGWIDAILNVPAFPDRLCYNSVNDKVYCLCYEAESVAVIDCASNVVVRSLALDDSPEDLCYNPTRNKVYCAADTILWVFDGASDAVITSFRFRPGAHWALCYNSQNDRVYYSYGELSGPDSVCVVDGESNAIIARIQAGGWYHMLGYHKPSNKVYCTENSNTVTVIDGAGDSVVASVPVGGMPDQICSNPQDNKVYCANDSDNGTVTVIDGASNAVLATDPIGSMILDLCYDSVDDRVFCLAESGFSVIDGASNHVVGTVPVDSAPFACCYCSRPDRVLSLCPNSSRVTVIDAKRLSVDTSLDVGLRPAYGCYNPKDDKAYTANSYGSTVSVLNASTDIGIEECRPAVAAVSRASATIMEGVLFLPEASGWWSQAASLLDATGRRVMELHSGANDVRALAPGVYFVRKQGSRSQGFEDSSVNKVVITR